MCGDTRDNSLSHFGGTFVASFKVKEDIQKLRFFVYNMVIIDEFLFGRIMLLFFYRLDRFRGIILYICIYNFIFVLNYKLKKSKVHKGTLSLSFFFYIDLLDCLDCVEIYVQHTHVDL